jgi:hypothetical protein
LRPGNPIKSGEHKSIGEGNRIVDPSGAENP